MKYPLTIEKDGSTFAVRFEDIPEALTCGDTYEEALEEAQDALITAFEFYFEDQRAVPMPSFSEGKEVVVVPANIRTKILQLNEKVFANKEALLSE